MKTPEEWEEWDRKVEEVKDKFRAEYKAKGFPESLDLSFSFGEVSSIDTVFVDSRFVEEKATPETLPLVFVGNWEDPDSIPVMPILSRGELWHEGWDIPTRWAIDSKHQCWRDSAHGGELEKVDTQHFLSYVEKDERVTRQVREVLGLKPLLPSWMQSALHAGWTPPPDFDRSKYE